MAGDSSYRFSRRVFLGDPPGLKSISYKVEVDENGVVSASVHISGDRYGILHSEDGRDPKLFLDKLKKLRDCMLYAEDLTEENHPAGSFRQWLNDEDSIFTGSCSCAVKGYFPEEAVKAAYFEVASCRDKVRFEAYSKEDLIKLNKLIKEMRKMVDEAIEVYGEVVYGR